jgi:hypothetical protein
VHGNYASKTELAALNASLAKVKHLSDMAIEQASCGCENWVGHFGEEPSGNSAFPFTSGYLLPRFGKPVIMQRGTDGSPIFLETD